MGDIYLSEGENEKAKQFLVKAEENLKNQYSKSPDAYCSNLAGCYNLLAYVYANQKDFTKALENIDRAIALIPEEADFYDSKGEILLMKGDEQGALEIWKKVIELNPQFVEQMGEFSNLYKQLKEKGLVE